MKPQEPLNQTFSGYFDSMCRSASNFWNMNTMARTGEQVIYVDLLSQDIRVALRILTMAASMQRHLHARIVALVGPDPYWRDMIWSYYDIDRLTQIGQAYGAIDVINLHDVVEASIAGKETFDVAGESVRIPDSTTCDPVRFRDIAEATHLRALRIPRVTDEVEASEEYATLDERCEHYARVYDALMQRSCSGFVVSHIDYHQWGYGVEAAMREGVPIFHVQSTGSFKVYGLYPETVDRELTARMNLTLQIADYFEKHIWPAREILSRSAEVVAFRAKSNHGRPSWWRGGGSISELGFMTQAERSSVRHHAMVKLGFDPDKPVVVVYNHAISDAVHSNLEIFEDLADWFTNTVEFASQHPEANWLLLDHPAQSNYDGTMMFEKMAAEYTGVEHLVFEQSMNLSKNVLWSLVDLAITVRGSVSNELPAYGVPAIQAGWSEWSHCGLSMRADTRDEYWRLITRTIDKLRDGQAVITEEQIQRARLWLWFYRSGTDVSSGFVPHWESSQADRLYMAVNLAFTQVESDGDAGLVAVRRMLKRHDPFLTRVDFEVPNDVLADALGVAGPLESSLPDQDPTERTDDDA